MFYAFDLRKLKKLFWFVILAIACFGAYLVLNKLYPVKYEALITKYANEYGLDKAFVFGVINAESRFDDKAVSRKGASGLMQLAKITADWGAEEIGIAGYDYTKVFEPEINIRIGCWYLAKLLNQYKNTETALAAYNAGSGNVTGWLNDKRYSNDGVTLHYIPFNETRNYVKKVTDNVKIYNILLENEIIAWILRRRT